MVSKIALESQARGLRDEAKHLERKAQRLRWSAGFLMKSADALVVHRDNGNGTAPEPAKEPKPKPKPPAPTVKRTVRRLNFGPQSLMSVAVYRFIADQPANKWWSVAACSAAVARKIAARDAKRGHKTPFTTRVSVVLSAAHRQRPAGYQPWTLGRRNNRSHYEYSRIPTP